jgi:hypothetical protein
MKPSSLERFLSEAAFCADVQLPDRRARGIVRAIEKDGMLRVFSGCGKGNR